MWSYFDVKNDRKADFTFSHFYNLHKNMLAHLHMSVSITIVPNHTGRPGVNKSNVGFGIEELFSCVVVVNEPGA